MRSILVVVIAITGLSLLTGSTSAATIIYQSNDPGDSNWFATAKPVAGDLAEASSTTVTLAAGYTWNGGNNPVFSRINDGVGGNGSGGTLGTSWYSDLGFDYSNFDKIHMDFGSSKAIQSVHTYSWQDFDNNDRRFPQVYTLYGSNAFAPATDDATLGGATWDLLASVDSTTEYTYSGLTPQANPSPEQLAVSIIAGGGSWTYRHLLFRITRSADPDGAGAAVGSFSPFWQEFDVVLVPEPSTFVLLIAGALGLLLCRRGKTFPH